MIQGLAVSLDGSQFRKLGATSSFAVKTPEDLLRLQHSVLRPRNSTRSSDLLPPLDRIESYIELCGGKCPIPIFHHRGGPARVGDLILLGSRSK